MKKIISLIFVALLIIVSCKIEKENNPITNVCKGDYFIGSGKSLVSINNCSSVTGDLTIGSTSLRNLDILNNITSVGGSFVCNRHYCFNSFWNHSII